MKWPPAREGSRAPSGRWRQPKEKSFSPFIPLVEALRVARAKTTVPPLQERIQSYKTFPERARQRVAESVIAKATNRKKSTSRRFQKVREPLPDVDVRRGFSPCARLSTARRARIAEADRPRCFDEFGARVDSDRPLVTLYIRQWFVAPS